MFRNKNLHKLLRFHLQKRPLVKILVLYILILVNTASGGSEVKFTNDIIKPTEKDCEQEYFDRYFLEDRRNKNIIEVKKSKYLNFKKKSYINSTSVKWDLTTPVENLKRGSYIYFGSAAKNKEAVLNAENDIKNLSSIIKNYGEFVK